MNNEELIRELRNPQTRMPRRLNLEAAKRIEELDKLIKQYHVAAEQSGYPRLQLRTPAELKLSDHGKGTNVTK